MKLEQNFIDICVKSSRLVNGINEISKDYSYAVTPGMEWFSRIYDVNNTTNLVSKILKNELPNTVILSGKDKSIIEKLEELNFHVNIIQTFMDINITGFDEKHDEAKVIVINTQELLIEWFSTLKMIFNVTEMNLFEHLMADNDISIIGLKINNEIVGTALLFIQNDMAGLHFIGILPEHRTKGYGEILVKNTLTILKDKNVKKVVLQSSDAGQRLYKKIGFKEKNKIYHYTYMN